MSKTIKRTLKMKGRDINGVSTTYGYRATATSCQMEEAENMENKGVRADVS
jgi:hypothetical protein